MNRLMFHILLGGTALAFVPGCEAKPSTMHKRQDQALKDPFNYTADQPADVSGGGLMDLNKEAFKKDIDSVFK
jgi:hypothetical protein